MHYRIIEDLSAERVTAVLDFRGNSLVITTMAGFASVVGYHPIDSLNENALLIMREVSMLKDCLAVSDHSGTDVIEIDGVLHLEGSMVMCSMLALDGLTSVRTDSSKRSDFEILLVIVEILDHGFYRSGNLYGNWERVDEKIDFLVGGILAFLNSITMYYTSDVTGVRGKLNKDLLGVLVENGKKD